MWFTGRPDRCESFTLLARRSVFPSPFYEKIISLSLSENFPRVGPCSSSSVPGAPGYHQSPPGFRPTVTILHVFVVTVPVFLLSGSAGTPHLFSDAPVSGAEGFDPRLPADTRSFFKTTPLPSCPRFFSYVEFLPFAS